MLTAIECIECIECTVTVRRVRLNLVEDLRISLNLVEDLSISLVDASHALTRSRYM